MEPIFLSITETPGVAAWPLVLLGAALTGSVCLFALDHATRLPRAPWAAPDSPIPHQPGALGVALLYSVAAVFAVLGAARVSMSPTPGTALTYEDVQGPLLTAAGLAMLPVFAALLRPPQARIAPKYTKVLQIVGLTLSGVVALAGVVALTTGPGERQRYEVSGRVFDVHHQVIEGEDGQDMEQVAFRVSGTGDYQFVVGAGTIGKIRDGADTPRLSCVPYQDGHHTFRNVLACAPAELGPFTTRPGYVHHEAVPVPLDRSLTTL